MNTDPKEVGPPVDGRRWVHGRRDNARALTDVGPASALEPCHRGEIESTARDVTIELYRHDDVPVGLDPQVLVPDPCGIVIDRPS